MKSTRPTLRMVAAGLLCTALSSALPLSGPLSGQAPPDAAQRVDEVFARWNSNTSAGCAVGVAVNGLTVLERGYGMSDLEHGIPNTPATIFEGGSLSKQFTAAAVVLLAIDGKLSLDDDARKYIPEVPDYGSTITLHQLMTHTSGLRDWGSVADISGWGREQRSHDHDWVIDIVSRQSALNFEPGHEYSYSNTGFNLLAVVVARVSGMSFADFSMERVFKPLGLRNTQWRDDYRRIVPGRSAAYDALPGNAWRINRPIEFVHGNGGILTTVGDLAIWNVALTDGRLGGADFVRMMHTQGILNDGSTITYAGGLVLQDFMGVPSITHTGATAGYRAYVGRFPDQGLSVAMLCNASNAPSGNGGVVARIFLGDAATAPVAPDPVPVAAATLARYAGLYRDPVTGNTRTLTVAGQTLRDGGATLNPRSETRFQVGARQQFYDFHATGSGPLWFGVDSWEYTDQRYEKVEPWTPSAADLSAFTGTYSSHDAETTFVVNADGGSLTLWRRPGHTTTLTPIYKDAFRGDRGQIVRFRRDGSGPVAEFSLSTGRVYDMRFQRQGG